MTHWTRRLTAAGLVALLLLIALLGKHGRFFTSRFDRQDSISSDQSHSTKAGPAPVVTSTITSGIHLLNNLRPAAPYVVDTHDGLVLVDSGPEPTRPTAAGGSRYRI